PSPGGALELIVRAARFVLGRRCRQKYLVPITPIGGAYGTAPAPLLPQRRPDGQLHPGRRALLRVAAIAEPAGPEAGTADRPAAVRSAGPQGGADRRWPAAAGARRDDTGGRGRGRAAPQGLRPAPGRAPDHRRPADHRPLRAALRLAGVPPALSTG